MIKNKVDMEENKVDMEEGPNMSISKVVEMTNYSISDAGLLPESFFHEKVSGSGGFTQQGEGIWTAMVLMVAMVMAIMALLGVFLIWVGIMSWVLGHDLRMDPRYVCVYLRS